MASFVLYEHKRNFMKTLVITAGGLSRRMGRDKVFLKIEGKTFLERIFLNACDIFDWVIISTDTEEHKAKILELPAIKNAGSKLEIITDTHERCGPIGGICTVFEETGAEKFAIIPTDVPFADMRVLEFFYNRCSGMPIIYKRDNGDLEPLIGAYGKDGYNVLKSAMDAGDFKIHKVLLGMNCEMMTEAQMIEADPKLSDVRFADSFVNINRPEDYGRFVADS